MMKKILRKILLAFAIKNTKISASYNLFDGEELLEYSVKLIRKHVKHISVVYQTVSNFGNPANSNVEEKLENLKKQGLIDELYLYEPDFSVSPHQNEKNKRDIGLYLAKARNCSHFISMDVDELYDEEQFEKAVNYIVRNNIKCSAVCLVDYLKSPENMIIGGYTFVPKDIGLYNFYAPFIIKINKFKKQKHGDSYFPCLTDPTRILYSKGKFKLFSPQEIVMHHMSTVRRDLNKKYDNSNLFDSPGETQEYLRELKREIIEFDFEKNRQLPQDCSIFRGCIVKKVANKFGIHFD